MKKEIRNLFFVIGSAILVAIAITAGALFLYGPSGQYKGSDVLIAARELAELNYNSMNPKIQQMDRYRFDEIVYRDKDGVSQKVSPQVYEKIYELVSKDKSLINPSQDVVGLFRKEVPAELLVKVRTESHDPVHNDVKDLIVMDISRDGNHFRVKLNEDEAGVHWAYFQHPGIYQKILKLLSA